MGEHSQTVHYHYLLPIGQLLISPEFTALPSPPLLGKFMSTILTSLIAVRLSGLFLLEGAWAVHDLPRVLSVLSQLFR